MLTAEGWLATRVGVARGAPIRAAGLPVGAAQMLAGRRAGGV